MSGVELLPCPFCGEAASALQSLRADRYGDWIAGCDNEQCNPQPETISSTREEAIAAWNRRAVPMEAVAWRWRYKGTNWVYGNDMPIWASSDDCDEQIQALALIPQAEDQETVK